MQFITKTTVIKQLITAAVGARDRGATIR